MTTSLHPLYSVEGEDSDHNVHMKEHHNIFRNKKTNWMRIRPWISYMMFELQHKQNTLRTAHCKPSVAVILRCQLWKSWQRDRSRKKFKLLILVSCFMQNLKILSWISLKSPYHAFGVFPFPSVYYQLLFGTWKSSANPHQRKLFCVSCLPETPCLKFRLFFHDCLSMSPCNTFV